MRLKFFALAVWLGASSAGAQALSQGVTGRGVPWAVVEVPGGDAEWVAVWLAADASPPPRPWEDVGGSFGRSVVLSVPALAAPAALGEAFPALSGAVAVVLLGPVPKRDLALALEALEGVSPGQRPSARCSASDGVVTLVRKESEGFRWAFPLPGRPDPRFELAEAAAWLLEKRWRAQGFSGPVRVEGGACPLLVFYHRGGDPRERLVDARDRRGELAAPVEEGEMTAFLAVQKREAHRWAVDPKGVALAACQRLGWGGALGPLFFPVAPSPAALTRFLAEVMEPAGNAEIYERERRILPPETKTLANGAVLVLTRTGGDTGLLAVALSGLDATVAGDLAQEGAVSLAAKGLPSQVTVASGMAAVAAVGSGEELIDALEELMAVVSRPRGRGGAGLRTQALEALGLGFEVFGENVAVVLALPEGHEELGEAAEKFLAAVPAGKVRQIRRLAPGLWRQERVGSGEVWAVVELPGTLAGTVVGEALAQRLAAQGVEVEQHHPPGGLVVLFGGGGAPTLPAQEERLASAWEEARLLGPEDTTKAWEALTGRLFGSAAQATARRALGVFAPSLAPPFWQPPGDEEVRQVAVALPGFRQLPRLGAGPAGAPAKGSGKGAQGGAR
ncbi:MAG: hypothetical protein ACP5NF_10975 [Thermoanaerobaculum sp.]